MKRELTNSRPHPHHLLLILLLALVVLVAAVILIAPQMPRLRDFDRIAAKSYASLLANGLQLSKTLAIDFCGFTFYTLPGFA